MAGAPTLLTETQYFPPVAFFAEAKDYSRVAIEAYENYQKGGYRNRCLIAGANGVQMLSIPLERGKHQQTPIKEVRISYAENWQAIHWKSIQSAYGKSPFFEYYALDLKRYFIEKFRYLFDWNIQLLETIIELMDFDFDIIETQAFRSTAKEDQIDIRNQMRPKKHKKQGAHLRFYPQVFQAKNGFIPNLSILDLLFCAGPEAIKFLEPKPNK